MSALLASAVETAPAPLACALCGAVGPETLYADCPDRRHWLPGRFDVVRCAGCGLAWTMPRPDEPGDLYPSSYASFAASACSSLGPLKRVLRYPYALRYGDVDRTPPPPRPGSRALDVGSGTGATLERLARAGWETFGIEPSAEAASRSPGRVFIGTLEEADLEQASFDLVTMSHVLEHLSDPLDALARIRRWLKPDGMLRIWVPNLASLDARVFGRLWFGLDVPRHLFHFSPRSLRLLLERSRFTIERLVPEYEASSLEGSVAHALDVLRRRRRQYRLSRGLYYGVFPASALLRALGDAGSLDCTARRDR